MVLCCGGGSGKQKNVVEADEKDVVKDRGGKARVDDVADKGRTIKAGVDKAKGRQEEYYAESGSDQDPSFVMISPTHNAVEVNEASVDQCKSQRELDFKPQVMFFWQSLVSHLPENTRTLRILL